MRMNARRRSKRKRKKNTTRNEPLEYIFELELGADAIETLKIELTLKKLDFCVLGIGYANANANT